LDRAARRPAGTGRPMPGCAPWGRAAAPALLPSNPRIQVRPRYQLAALSIEEKTQERDRLIVRISQKRIVFRDGSSALSAHSDEVLRNVAEVFLEYPELSLDIECYPDQKLRRKLPEKELGLLHERAGACRDRLVELGVLSDLSLLVYEDGAIPSPRAGGSAGGRESCITFRASRTGLLEPQLRLDYLLSRRGFDFLQSGVELSEKGLKVADAIARVIRERPNRVLIEVPKGSSELALQRAQAIARGIKSFGVNSEVSVEIAVGSLKYATVRFDEDLPRTRGPQGQLMDILEQTPLAFRMNSSELVPEVLPAIRRCAEVLKQVKHMSVLIEAYSGTQRMGGAAEARVREVMLRRAERVAAWLQAEGVEIPILPRGHAATLPDGATPNGQAAARVVLTLISDAERVFEPVVPEDREACCMGDRANMLGCL